MSWADKRAQRPRTHRHLREQILAQHPTCYLRLPGCTVLATEDDHVIPISRGGCDLPANRRGICHSCHVTKTAYEAAAAKPRARRRPERSPGWR